VVKENASVQRGTKAENYIQRSTDVLYLTIATWEDLLGELPRASLSRLAVEESLYWLSKFWE
jgi:hypothetical protein